MFRGCVALVVFTVLVAGCGGGGPTPGFVFQDTGEPTGDGSSGMDAVTEDAVTALDGSTADSGTGDTGPEDSMASDTLVDTGPTPDCEVNDDCAHLSGDPCTFWFCHPTQKTCKPATFPDGDPCSDDDVCTVGDTCEDGACVSGAVILPPEAWDDPCNELACDPLTGWHPVPVTGPCDDEDPCTSEDQCHAGVCVGGGDLCPDPGCGDGICQDLEHCESCPEDCGACGTNCCSVHEGKGCDDPTCQGAVCGVDVFCCNSQWDQICVGRAQKDCDVCSG
ncbi:MAG: hypothetical protein ABIK09_04355 [Pseudomonadota bacterium]